MASIKQFLGLDSKAGISRSILLIATVALSYVAVILPFYVNAGYTSLHTGDVAPQDVLAPRNLTYLSDVLTRQAQEQAASAVSPVYLSASPDISRAQIEHLQSTLDYINSVRHDTYSLAAKKVSDLTNMQPVVIDVDMAQQILSFTDDQWNATQQESLNVLGQIMRSSIDEDQVSRVRDNLPTYISFSLSQDETSIVTALVSPFIAANSLYSEDETNRAKDAARSAVTPVTQTYISGETIVTRGEIITPEKMEALQQYGLAQPSSNSAELLAALAITIALFGFVFLYFNRRKVNIVQESRSLFVIALLFLLFLFAARLVIPDRTVIPYLFPLPAFAMVVASLFGLELGIILSLVMSLLAAFALPSGLDLTVYYMLASLCGILVLLKGRRIASFFWSGLAIGVVASASVVAYRLAAGGTDLYGLLTLIGAAFLCGLASSSVTLILQYVVSQLLGLITPLQLIDLSRPDHPLLQMILRNAPGTYQHSLQVANMAEQAAEKISADAVLTRVGALFHDAGKAANPAFFVENQVPSQLDLHENLSPYETALIIIKHVPDGVELAHKYQLPSRLIDFIKEHHGDLITRFQYARAQGDASDKNSVDINAFRYPGPRPRSRETAVLMLADSCEAKARAELPKSESEIRELVMSVIQYCQDEGQMELTNLTMRDLHTIAESFISTLKNTYHPRIQYPAVKAVSHSAVPPKND
jgi:putative nucleotidyltransferase with HDIG domain